MTDSIEFYASTIDEAVEKAALELGLASAEVSYRVLDEGNSGFLGIGARDARIIVDAPAQHTAGEVDELPETTRAENVVVDEAESEPSESAGDAGSSSLSEVYGEQSDSEEIVAPEELLEEIRALVSSILDAMGFEARVEIYDAGGFIAADVAPDNTALFIGQKGETIDALQYLVNVSAFRERPFFKRIVLDAEGYRQRRVEAIQGMAHRTARRAVRERRTVEMPPMNSSERRVVHLFLSDNPGVTTESEGSGDNRRVKVSPSS
ncbi:MAG TPA: RNA-binding cell elongation regulator Jag/EloR [Rubrobacter sp.]|jgi:spoIIIJ-associated protein|nr:RNA-binding cell elongation regulator Jag/EloR [Rubrobacter sp.]